MMEISYKPCETRANNTGEAINVKSAIWLILTA